MATPTTSAETKSTIDDLITTCRDGENGFDSAAKAIEDPVLKAELMQYSGQRSEFAAELVEALGQQGETADDGGSISATLHRGWINIKEAITGKDKHAILAECERGEDSAVSAYRKASSASLPTAVANIVSTQHQAVQRVHDRIKALRDSSK